MKPTAIVLSNFAPSYHPVPPMCRDEGVLAMTKTFNHSEVWPNSTCILQSHNPYKWGPLTQKTSKTACLHQQEEIG